MDSRARADISASRLRFRLRTLVVMLTILCCLSCSKDRVPTALPDTHTQQWMDPSSPDFHGAVVISNGGGSCTKCHGIDFKGGSSRKSCVECHAQRATGCIGCHGGSADSTGAPPSGLRQETSDSALAVGAHAVHLHGSSRAASVACASCHTVPGFVLDSAHLDRNFATGTGGCDSIAEIRWSGISNKNGAAAWDRTAGTCSHTYCHGNFTGGKAANAPTWNAQDQAACGSCHDIGADPASLAWKHELHVKLIGKRCADCHAGVVDAQLHITNANLHVNGTADTLTADTSFCVGCHSGGTNSCVTCHGGTDNETGAPPKGLHGETQPTSRAVGAHTIHLAGSGLASAIPCNSCHVVPPSTVADGHLGADSVAEISWGGLSDKTGGANWDRSSATCQATYCHGNFTGGDNTNTPVWNGTGQAACGTCHDVGADPASLLWKHDVHVSGFGLKCADCHAGVVDLSLSIIDPSLHVNGTADTLRRDTAVCNVCHGSGTGGCVMCHGGVDNQSGAPPKALHGDTATLGIGVGAHTRHMDGGTQANAFLCTSCHTVPASVLENGHLGADSVAEVTWGSISNLSGGANWNRTARSCSLTYCHGNFTGGKASNTPIWTGTNQGACGSCHDVGSDPASLAWKHELHIGSFHLTCADCHANVVNTQHEIVERSLHVNGVVDMLVRDSSRCELCHGSGPAQCTSCHGGTDNLTGAPPRGLRGETASSTLAVGAHTKHLEGSTISDGVPCSECHIVPSSLSSTGHWATDSVAEVTWGDIANLSEGAAWNRTNATCARTYCHGNFSGGKAATTPIWTTGNQASCGSCHDVGSNPSDLLGEHETHVQKGYGCYRCHSSVVNSSNQITGFGQHVDGAHEVIFWNGIGSYDSSTHNCSNPGGCHGTRTWQP